MPIPALIAAAGLGAGSNLLSNIFSSGQNQANVQAQRDLLKWQKEAQQTTWNREDNAVQRRVNDLKLAGISPQAAAGGAAASSGPIGMKAPQGDPSVVLKQQQNMQATINSVANIAQTLAQTQVLKATGEIKNVEADVAGATKFDQIDHIKSDALSAQSQSQTAKIAIKQAEQSLQSLELDNQYNRKTMTNRIAEQAKKTNISRIEAKNLQAHLDAKLRGYRVTAKLNSGQLNRLMRMLPYELEAKAKQNIMTALQITDYETLAPSTKSTVKIIIDALRLLLK